jgi:hypothetical protein
MKKHFGRTELVTLLNRSPEPSGAYVKLMTWFWNFRGDRLEYGTDIYIEHFTTDLKGMAPFVVFKPENGIWSAVTVIEIVKSINPINTHRAYNLYLPNKIEFITLTEDAITAGFLRTRDWKLKAKQAVYSPCVTKEFKLPSLESIRELPTISNIMA